MFAVLAAAFFFLYLQVNMNMHVLNMATYYSSSVVICQFTLLQPTYGSHTVQSTAGLRVVIHLSFHLACLHLPATCCSYSSVSDVIDLTVNLNCTLIKRK